jgi:hypothetical protein
MRAGVASTAPAGGRLCRKIRLVKITLFPPSAFDFAFPSRQTKAVIAIACNVRQMCAGGPKMFSPVFSASAGFFPERAEVAMCKASIKYNQS